MHPGIVDCEIDLAFMLFYTFRVHSVCPCCCCRSFRPCPVELSAVAGPQFSN